MVPQDMPVRRSSVSFWDIKMLRLNGTDPEVILISPMRMYSRTCSSWCRISVKERILKPFAMEVDVVFTATPQGLCSTLVSESVLERVKIIDLSADFRIKDVATYEDWYGIKA